MVKCKECNSTALRRTDNCVVSRTQTGVHKEAEDFWGAENFKVIELTKMYCNNCGNTWEAGGFTTYNQLFDDGE